MQLQGNKTALALSFQISTSIPQLWGNKSKEFPSINLKENCKEFIFNAVSIYKLFFFFFLILEDGNWSFGTQLWHTQICVYLIILFQYSTCEYLFNKF